jgi:hypothetical protein
VPNSDFIFGRPYRDKRRLTNKEKREVEEWEQTTRNMYECGHRSGNLIEFWPGEIVRLGNLIGSIFRGSSHQFEIFTRIGDWRCYEDELLLIPTDKARLWLTEIEEIRQGLQGLGDLPRRRIVKLISVFYRDELESRTELERRLGKAAEKMPSVAVEALRQNVQGLKWDMEIAIETLNKALSDAIKLCQASFDTKNEIRFLW